MVGDASHRKKSHRSVQAMPRQSTSSHVASSNRPQRTRRLPVRLQECDGSESASSPLSEPSESRGGGAAAEEGSDLDVGEERDDGPSPPVRPRVQRATSVPAAMHGVSRTLPPFSLVQRPELATADGSVWGRTEGRDEAVSAVRLHGRT